MQTESRNKACLGYAEVQLIFVFVNKDNANREQKQSLLRLCRTAPYLRFENKYTGYISINAHKRSSV